jgi:hypothetical protein
MRGDFLEDEEESLDHRASSSWELLLDGRKKNELPSPFSLLHLS